jgi:hypothetical protein
MSPKVCGIALAVLATLSLAFLALATDVALADDGDEPEPEPTQIEYLQGYVFEIPPQMDRQPIAGVVVKTWISVDRMYGSDTTKEDGMFKVQYNPDIRYISFSVEDYTVKDWCSELKKAGDTGMFEIDLKDDSEVDGVHYLYDNSGSTVIISRTIGTIFGNVVTTIGNAIVPLEGASVTIESSSTLLTTKTDESGHYSMDCPTGTTYHITVTSSGFKTWTADDVEPSKEAFNIRMQQKDHDVIFGLDLAHTLMLIGLLIFLVIAILAIYIVRRPEGMDKIAVINDLPEVKIDEGRDEDD